MKNHPAAPPPGRTADDEVPAGGVLSRLRTTMNAEVERLEGDLAATAEQDDAAQAHERGEA